MTSTTYYTKDGLKKLREELQRLKSVVRPQISKQIADARDKGDLSENAEYDAAKERQGLVELEISKIEKILASARMIKDSDKIDTSKALILSTVKVLNLNSKKEASFTLVAEKEVDIKQNKISVESPIAKGLLGKKIGETANIVTPNGSIKFKILEINR